METDLIGSYTFAFGLAFYNFVSFSNIAGLILNEAWV